MRNRELSTSKVMFTLTLLVIFASALFGVGVFDFLTLNRTYSYLNDGGKVMNVVMIAPIQLNVYQTIDTTTTNCTETGIDLQTRNFATDKIYTYNVFLKNDEVAGSEDAFYIRWKFVVTLDGETYENVNAYCTPNSSSAVLSGDYYYYVDNNNASQMLLSGETVNLLEEICFTGEYDATTGTYGSILDQKFYGSDFDIEIVIEGSITQYTIS